MAKIYLSPAAHATDNRTQCPMACSENTHCNAYTDKLEARLRELGFEVKRGTRSLTGSLAMTTRVAEANQWKADLYYVAHSNAGGGRYSMTMCYTDKASKEKADILHKYRRNVRHVVRQRGDLYEINATAMPCLYDELFFHDNAEDCAWFHNGGMDTMAEETVQALCEICGVPYQPHTEPEPEQPEAPEQPAEPEPERPTESKPEQPAAPEPQPTPAPAAPQAGDAVQLTGGRLYTTARGSRYVTRTGTFYLYDGQRVGSRYRVTNRADRVGKSPVWIFTSGWIEG